MLKRIALGFAGLVLLGLVGFAVFAYRPAIAPIDRPTPAGFSPQRVAQGEILASAGYCAVCHTARHGAVLAGGYPMVTQFGTIYSTNITPDAETGIGHWSEAAFRRALHEGVARDGSHLFPALPYDHFTKLSDADVGALYAYLMTRAPVHAPAKADTVPFPLNIRALQAGWKLLFFHPGRFQPRADKSAEWNRGAYLAEGLGHCGGCHTPRNTLGAEEAGKAYAGAPIDGWIAPSLRPNNPSPVAWDESELVSYLSTGMSRYHGTSYGSMGPVTRGLSRLSPSDIQALSVYFADLDGAASRMADAPAIIARATATSALGGATYDSSARLYAAACASCHYNTIDKPNPLRPDLALTSAVAMDDPTNLIQVMLRGVGSTEGAPGVVMPAFTGFSDADIAGLAAYLRATRTTKAPWPDLQTKVAAIRAANLKRGAGA